MPAPKKWIKKNTDMDMSNQSLLAVFSEFIVDRKALGRAKETITAYEATYRKFDKYFGARADDTGNIYGSMFIEWTNAMRDEVSNGKKLTATTINHHLRNMRAFMYWCMDDSRKYIEPFKIRLIKEQEQMPKDYTPEEIKTLLKKPNSNAKLPEWRSWIACCFVVGTGARLGTMVEIRMKDINLKDGIVHYQHTKNKKVQNANLSPQLVKSLNEYITTWRYDVEDDDYLLCNVSGEKVSKASLTQGYATYANNRGVKKTNIHGLRHTFARMWFENGGDVIQLSKILGHSTLAMSEHYMNVYATSARDRFIQYNPLENITRSGAKQTVKKRK